MTVRLGQGLQSDVRDLTVLTPISRSELPELGSFLSAPSENQPTSSVPDKKQRVGQGWDAFG